MQVADDSFMSDRAVFRSESQAVSDRILTAEIDAARALGFTGEIDGIAVVGHPIEEFERISHEANLIVLGDHTGSRVAGAFFGSRSVKIAAVSAAPIVVVPHDYTRGTSGVVVGVDGSDAAQAAIHYAAEEASRLQVGLTAVYAWMPPLTPGLEQLWSEELLEAQQSTAEEALAIATAGLAERYPDVEVHRKVVQAPPIGALAADAAGATLLVVGSRGRGNFARLLLGSVSQGVLSNPPCPVVVTKATA
jgi:nucleotide-binding universal stress UspA family protein